MIDIYTKGHEYGIAGDQLDALAKLDEINFDVMKSALENICEYVHTFTSRSAFVNHYVFKDGTIASYHDFGAILCQCHPKEEDEIKVAIVKDLQEEIKSFNGMASAIAKWK